MQPGPIVLKNGDIIGEHQGLSRYTIGQRKGLGVSYDQPLYVIAMNPYRNALVVGTRDELGRDELVATRVNWIAGEPPSQPIRAEVKIRYRSSAVPATVQPLADDSFHVKFDAPLRDIAPGQAAVIYQDENCLGGGVIAPHQSTPDA